MSLALACGEAPAPAPAPVDAAPAGPPAPFRCDAHDDLGGTAWLPADLRLAAVIDLDSPDLPAAITRLQTGVQAGRGLPVVAGLGLGQLGLQLGLLRPQLITAGLRPRELALLHDRTGAVIWIVRARCDLEALQAAIARTWSLQIRGVTGGSVAEAVRGPEDPAGVRFAFDVAFLSEDRLALTPPGMAASLRRWLEAGPVTPSLGVAPGPPPGEVLGDLPAAPIRAVLAGRALQAEGAAEVPLVRTLRATASGLEVDGVP